MGERSQFRLLGERRFGPFFGVQYQTASFTSLSADTLQNFAQALFVAPFFLFSATAGQIVCNHVSYVDALVMSAACRRPIRWVMYYQIFRIPLLSFFFRTVRAIPIAGAKEDPQMLERTPVPVVPMALSGLWRSLFARNPQKGGDKLRRLRHLFPRVRLTVGAPLAPAAATPDALRAAVLELRGPWR